jgi:hypothetical protein
MPSAGKQPRGSSNSTPNSASAASTRIYPGSPLRSASPAGVPWRCGVNRSPARQTRKRGTMPDSGFGAYPCGARLGGRFPGPKLAVAAVEENAPARQSTQPSACDGGTTGSQPGIGNHPVFRRRALPAPQPGGNRNRGPGFRITGCLRVIGASYVHMSSMQRRQKGQMFHL